MVLVGPSDLWSAVMDHIKVLAPGVGKFGAELSYDIDIWVPRQLMM